MKKRVVVTGGTGFIGTQLCTALAAKGYHVIQVSHRKREAQTSNDGITQVDWNGIDGERLLPYIDGAYGIIHLAGENIASRWTRQKKDAILRSRVASGNALVAAITQANKKPSVLIQASALGYYGNTGTRIIDERAHAGNSFLSSVCIAWEASTAPVEALKVRRVIVRTAPVLGKQGILPRMQQPFRFYIGGHVGTGEQYFSFIHIEDEVRALIHLLESNKSKGAYNLCAPHPVQQDVFARTLGNTLHRPSWLHVPAGLLKALYGDMAVETLLTSQRAIPRRLLDEKFVFRFPIASDALQDLAKAH